jgi:hypothetical protein
MVVESRASTVLVNAKPKLSSTQSFLAWAINRWVRPPPGTIPRMQRPQRHLLRYDYLHYDHASMTATISMDLGSTITIRSPTRKYS